ncbi:MAG: pyridoxal 5'-phosphate synthase glutaminase subunit PdxT [Spirochaetales bacterium]|nr:pyridoxal 5'-phosphate synthase glutaminase subunit PdxT [Spirochaetales bacterium]
MSARPVGVLSLQGAFERHKSIIESLGRECRLIRTPEQLAGLGGLIIPGGESTVIGKLMKAGGLLSAIRDSAADGLSIFGTCAGLILLANEVTGTPVDGLHLLDVRVQRNGYGRQKESFNSKLIFRKNEIQSVFIRAPRIIETGPNVEVICRMDDEAVLVRQDRILAAAFHPELTDDPAVHRYYVEELC